VRSAACLLLERSDEVFRKRGDVLTYDELVLRNDGYVPPETQDAIRKTRVLIAGCGLGSTIAEAAVRIGFDRLVLVDGDVVAVHNLNRQVYSARDVDQPKVTALARRLREINPAVEVTAVFDWVTTDNAAHLVRDVDLVFDTIDFLALPGVVALHDECQRKHLPVVSAMTVGWGAAAVYFPPHDCSATFRELFGLPPTGSVDHESYVERFAVVVERLAEVLDPAVTTVVGRALARMEDGRPCPAPQVAPGGAAIASLAITMAVRVLRGEAVVCSPHMVLIDVAAHTRSRGVDLRPRGPR